MNECTLTGNVHGVCSAKHVSKSFHQLCVTVEFVLWKKSTMTRREYRQSTAW